MVNYEPLCSLQVETLPLCESYLEGKMTKRPFTSKGHKAKEVLELVQSDLLRPMSIQTRGDFECSSTLLMIIQDKDKLI